MLLSRGCLSLALTQLPRPGPANPILTNLGSLWNNPVNYLADSVTSF